MAPVAAPHSGGGAAAGRSSSSSSSSSSSAAATASLLKSLLRQHRGAGASSSRRRRGGGRNVPLSESEDVARLDELRRTFARLVAEGELASGGGDAAARNDSGGGSTVGKEGNGEAEEDGRAGGAVRSEWSAYLRRRRDEFVSQLSDRVSGAGRQSALRTFCGVVASNPAPVAGVAAAAAEGGGGGEMVDQDLVRRMIESLVYFGGRGAGRGGGSASAASASVAGTTTEATDDRMLDLLEREFLRPHYDARYFSLYAVREIADAMRRQRRSSSSSAPSSAAKNEKVGGGSGGDDGVAAENLLRVLLRIEIPASDEELNASGGGFLFPPPVLEGKEANDLGEDDEEEEEENDDDDSEGSSSEDESSEDDDDEPKRKRSNNSGASSSARKKFQNQRRPAWQLVRRYRRALQETWLSVLRVPSLPPRAIDAALRHLPANVLPQVHDPLRFSEFFTRAYGGSLSAKGGEGGGGTGTGVTPVLALEGLFVLMTEHGLEYPKFYASLYRLVDRRNMYAKYRTRFLRLLGTCLGKSDMVPAYAVAAFCKRLCRTALACPPSGALFALALTSNLLRKHGEVACLVHRGGGSGGGGGEMEDRFDPAADDPANARALESSLWELEALGRHYHPAVAALAESCGTEDDVASASGGGSNVAPLHDLEEFLGHTYRSLFEAERKRAAGGDDSSSNKKKKRKRIRVPVTFQEPKGLFVKGDVFEGVLDVPTRDANDTEK